MPRRSARRRPAPSGDAGEAPDARRRRTTESQPGSRVRRLGLDDLEGRRKPVVLGRTFKILSTVEAKDEKALNIKAIDLHKDENRKQHHTYDYEIDSLFVRRGQGFKVSVKFGRKYDKDSDKVTVQFATGAQPQESKGTLIRIPVEHKAQVSSDWKVRNDGVSGDLMKLTIQPPADAIVGKYRLFVETFVDINKDGKGVKYRTEGSEIYVLFNAWCPEDSVFMENEDERREYVMNEGGRIWVGSEDNNYGRPWNFGQFDDVCVEAALYLMDKAELIVTARSNPIPVVRTLSAMTNSMDDNGALTGRWTKDYPKDSTVPWAWTGSVAILDEFMKTKESVRFGQCWVFSGLFTTLCRALGIPTRSVTNFQSAHDTDESMTIDNHWLENGDPYEDMDDSVWNFHVWNDVWFKRPDLPAGYDGWQAVDATPQELSEGVMRCGPAPLKAVKEGHVYLRHDVPFVYAEVNGDRIHWEVKEDETMEVISLDKDSVGKNISTKAVGSYSRMDVTHLYKYPEGSADERRVVRSVLQYGSRRHLEVYKPLKEDVKFIPEIPKTGEIGQNLAIKVLLKNESSESRRVRVNITTIASFYTGVPSDPISKKAFVENLGGKAEKEVVLNIAASEYMSKLAPEAFIRTYIRGVVEETKQNFVLQKNFQLKKPTLLLQAPERGARGEEFKLNIKFTNPYDKPLTDAVFYVQAPGIVKSLVIPHKKKIAAGETIEREIKLTPYRAGQKEIIVTFYSNELNGLDGSREIYVPYSNY